MRSYLVGGAVGLPVCRLLLFECSVSGLGLFSDEFAELFYRFLTSAVVIIGELIVIRVVVGCRHSLRPDVYRNTGDSG